MAAGLNMANEDLMRTKRKHEMLAALLDNREFSDVRLERKAIEDLGTSPLGKAAINTVLFAVGAGLLLIVVIVLVQREHDDLAGANAHEDNSPRSVPRVVAMKG